MGPTDECGPCFNVRCSTPQAVADEWSDADHCGNWCPHDADTQHAYYAANAANIDEDMLATYMARYPDRVNEAMWAAYDVNIARENAVYTANRARAEARRLAANNAAHPKSDQK